MYGSPAPSQTASAADQSDGDVSADRQHLLAMLERGRLFDFEFPVANTSAILEVVEFVMDNTVRSGRVGFICVVVVSRVLTGNISVVLT